MPKNTKGYEHYAQMAQALSVMPEGFDLGQVFLNDHVWGTPDQCVERLTKANDFMRPAEFIGVMKVRRHADRGRGEEHAALRQGGLPFAHELPSEDAELAS